MPAAADAPVVRTRPGLWEAAKRRAVAELGGRFSARAMQRAVRIYKARGGGYASRPPPPHRNALARWTRERWAYAGRPGESRYLPSFVIARLTAGQRRRTNATKKRGARQWTRQPADVARLAAQLKRRYWSGAERPPSEKREPPRSGKGWPPRAERSEARRRPERGPLKPQANGARVPKEAAAAAFEEAVAEALADLDRLKRKMMV